MNAGREFNAQQTTTTFNAHWNGSPQGCRGRGGAAHGRQVPQDRLDSSASQELYDTLLTLYLKMVQTRTVSKTVLVRTTGTPHAAS